MRDLVVSVKQESRAGVRDIKEPGPETRHGETGSLKKGHEKVMHDGSTRRRRNTKPEGKGGERS